MKMTGRALFWILFNLLLVICVSEKMVKFHQKKEKVIRETEDLLKSFSAWTKPKRRGDKLVHLTQHSASDKGTRQRRETGNNFGSAIYLDGSGQLLKLRFQKGEGRIRMPQRTFTVQMWAKPEGGQGKYTPIIDLFDECERRDPKSRWSVGIKSVEFEPRNARFAFSLKTETSPAMSDLLAHKRYEINTWTHVTATYDGQIMSLYINGAKISLGHEQKGAVFGPASDKCKTLIVGGSVTAGTHYRGKLDELRLWDRALDHKEVVESMFVGTADLGTDEDRVLSEPFESLDQWRIRGDHDVELIPSDVRLASHHVRFEAPPCGETVCDDPEAVLSYATHPQLRREKVLRYSVVNIMDDNGENPTVTPRQIRDQHKALLNAYEPYNISFTLDQITIRNTTLRQRVIIFDCSPYKVGNYECDEQCRHSTTGNDGGDCDQIRSECWSGLLGNGKCDAECNKVYHDYDGGDCCLPGPDTHITCIDPVSPLKAYIDIDELKSLLKLDGSDHINIFFTDASWLEYTMVGGVATFPWDKHVFSSLGGTIIHRASFGRAGRKKALVHELGHNLGLYHVHHGISEMFCDDACVETHASMVLGDLCSDTNPTPKNAKCYDPHPDNFKAFEDTCGVYAFEDTPFNNYMSYADDRCIDHFTPQQVARMHCYLDLVYQPMRQMKAPAPIPIAPKVVAADSASVTLVWLPPLGLDSSCDSDHAFSQYATVAIASHSHIRWAPHEATGSPDAERCQPSLRAWMPHHPISTPSCTGNTCWLELGFKFPVVPRRLSVWVADIELGASLDIRLVTVDGKVIKLGTALAFCDMETTVLVNTEETVDKVRIHTSDSYVAIDAVQLVSMPDYPTCTKRKRPKYKVTRDPPFTSGYVMTADTQYIDTEVDSGVTYLYSVQSVLDSRASAVSPSLAYSHGAAFCGDGHVDSANEEDCDDGNARDGDGCSLDCRVEESFNCVGSPSLCYIHAGDGICEDFERETVEQDCGFYTPPGFSDQWASSAIANPVYQLPECPESAIIGQPQHYQKCQVYADTRVAWRPCREIEDFTGDFWVETFFGFPVVATEVLVHLGSDGNTPIIPEPKSLHVELIDVEDNYVPLTPRGISLSCWDSPVRVPVLQDLSRLFFLTKGVRLRFTSSSISIAAVRLRSSTFIDPITMSSCERNELYNARSGQCVEQSCSESSCAAFPVKYGVADCTGNMEGDICTVQCDVGFSTGHHGNRATCKEGSWRSDSSGALVCSPIDCRTPVVPHATVACPDGTKYRQECYFKCNKPAILQGSDTTLRCQDNGRWTAQAAQCLVMCAALSDTHHQKGELKTPLCAEGPQGVGKVCKVRCRDGYHVEGERSRRRLLRIECGTDGRWDGLTCVRNQCPAIDSVFTGAYACTDERYSGSTCSLTCPGGSNVQKITCNEDGLWDGAFEVCSSLQGHTCDNPTATDSLRVKCQGNTVGSSCNVSCSDPNTTPIRRHRTEENDVIKTYSYVDVIKCSVTSLWVPSLSSLTCVNRCIESIGDGICDADNNREHCEWDGGDCCSSTVFDGVVSTIPEDCSVDCLCRDPNAIENKRRKRRHKYAYRLYSYEAPVPEE